MNKILVPIQTFSWLSLSASYFAIKFAKRNPTKILFLVFSTASFGDSRKEEEACRRQFDGLIQQARAEKINLELFFSNDEYLPAVRQFARDHNTTEIVIGLPRIQDPAYPALIQDVNALRDEGENQILIVKPREEQNPDEWREPPGRIPCFLKSRAAPDKKGL